MSESTSDTARSLIRTRWDRPDNLERRVDSLAREIRRRVSTMPPLSDSQQAKLTAALEGR